MTDSSDQDLRIPILTKLYRRSLWGKSYTTVENSLSKIPKHDRGRAKEVLEEMNQEGLIRFHKGGNCVSLNPNSKEKIENILGGHLPDYLMD